MDNYIPPRFEENQGLVRLMAQKGYRMAVLNHAVLDFEDCFQEASICFLKTAELFDPDAGFKFSALYTRVCWTHFQKVVQEMSGTRPLNKTERAEVDRVREANKQRAGTGEASLDPPQFGLRPTPFSHFGLPEGIPFEDTLVSPTGSPEEILDRAQRLDALFASKSELTQQVIDWLREPPPELVDELNKWAAHVQHFKLRSRKAIAMGKGLTVDNIGRFLQTLGVPVDAIDMALVNIELSELVREVESV